MLAKILCALGFSFFVTGVQAQSAAWTKVDGSRGASIEYMVYKPEKPDVAVVILPGGSWQIGSIDPTTNLPDGSNILIRSIPLMQQKGMAVFLMNKPINSPDLSDAPSRYSQEHGRDILVVIEQAKKLNIPVFLFGTSYGALSSGAVLNLPERRGIAGLALASPTTRRKDSVGLLDFDLSGFDIPTLIIFHEKDACGGSMPRRVPELKGALRKSPSVTVISIASGASPTGNICGPTHWHGFINAENELISLVHKWMIERAK